MLKYLVGILVTACLAVPFNAAGSAKQELILRLQQLQSFTADFEQVVSDAQANVMHQASGSIALAQPDNLRWHTTEPDEIMLIADGESVYQIDYFVEQISIVNQSDAINSNPMMLLTSTDPLDWEDFTVSRVDSGYQITGQQQASIISLELIFKNDLLSIIRSVDSQEQQSQLTFSEQIENGPLSAEMFQPNLPAEFIIDDQRQ